MFKVFVRLNDNAVRGEPEETKENKIVPLLPSVLLVPVERRLGSGPKDDQGSFNQIEEEAFFA